MEVRLLVTCQVDRGGIRPPSGKVLEGQAYEAAVEVVAGTLKLCEEDRRNHHLRGNELFVVHVSAVEPAKRGKAEDG